MRFNQLSYIPTPLPQILSELQDLGFQVSEQETDKVNFEAFVRRTFLNYQDTDYPLSMLLANQEQDFLQFCQSSQDLSPEVFYQVSLQILGFVPGVDFSDPLLAISEMGFPVQYQAGQVIEASYHLLSCRHKSGNSLIDYLVAQDLITEDNHYHFFNGKALATFNSRQAIREVVYVESGLDTDEDGEIDLVKVSIVRPHTAEPVPVVITNSPYQQGVNETASDKAIYQMAGELAEKEPGQISVTDCQPISPMASTREVPLVDKAEETFTYHGRRTTLNDYFLSRGFANIYVSGIGTLGSEGLMTSGDYRQIQSFKAVIDWLNGRARAYTSHRRDKAIAATWSNGKVATTGISYLGTLSTGLATTGVEGLEVIIAEAGISSWYDYYRENGLVMSPGGYPGEDLDSLAQLTYSKSLQAGDYLKSQAVHQAFMEKMAQDLDRQRGDYSQFWHDRNYLPHLANIKAEVVYTHGLQDWNVKPIHVYNVFQQLAPEVKKHLFLHHGDHVYMNNWQSIDFRETINALLCQRLLGLENQFHLDELIWQNNQKAQDWQALSRFGSDHYRSWQLGQGQVSIANHYPEETFARYDKDYQAFKQDLFEDKAHQITIDFKLEDCFINGPACLKLRLKSSINKGLISAQILDYGPRKRLTPIPQLVTPYSVDCGRSFGQEDLKELPFVDSPYRVLSKGHLNLQNRNGLMTIDPVPADQWMDCQLQLQPTIYHLEKGDQLRIVLYTTDFEHTVRDNGDWEICLDLGQSELLLPLS